ncbi:CdaR family protein [Enterococcus asini]|uniref:CdaR family protein n=1 Tax=Enterococcus asini TaxID=57732 RepID=UPI00288DD0A0|nr:CdaR family protein [Enterococcus asini]MDT2756892.1 CdaR family protein [Enterococcus asini]
MKKPKIRIRTNVLYGFTALIFALILFFYANGRSLVSQISTNSTEAFEETLNNVKVQPYYDNEKYYIHGYSPTVSVKLSSINRVQLNAEANVETRNFEVIADLTGLGEGTHEVKLRLQNMSSAVSGTITPAKITVTIESKASEKMSVEPVVSTANLTEGYTLDSVSVSPEEVNITTGAQTLKEIDRLVATVDSAKVTDENLEEKVRIQALDKEGNTLSVESDPAEVTVKVVLSAPQKQVLLYPQQTGTLASNVSSVALDLAETTAIITGQQSALDEISELPVLVDVSDITRTTTKKVPILVDDGLTVQPTEVSVTITPRLATSNSTTTPSSNSQTRGNQSTNNQETTPSTTKSSEAVSSTSTSESSASQESTTNSKN